MDRITKAKQYMLQLFDESSYLSDKPYEKAYRVDHTLRVSSWGKFIAEKEHLDVEALVVGCLLHDISYIEEMRNREEQLNHGRRSAEISESFIKSLDFDSDTTKDILHGIAIHVDGRDKPDINRRNSILAKSISDADNLDRFDVYRIYESLMFDKFSIKNNNEKVLYCENRLARIEQNLKTNFSTNTATREFHQELKRSQDFFKHLLVQMQRTI